MITQAKLSALLMFTGFIFLLSAGILAPPGVYRAPQLEEKLTIIENHQSRWLITNTLGAIGLLSISIGFVIFSLYLWSTENKFLLLLGTAGYVISALSISLQSYRRITDPAVQLAGESSLDQIGFYALLFAVFVFGFIFLQIGYSSWFGYLSIGAAVILGLAAAFTNLAIAEIAYIIPLVASIVIWRGG